MPEHHRKDGRATVDDSGYYFKQAADNGPPYQEFFEKLMKK